MYKNGNFEFVRGEGRKHVNVSNDIGNCVK